MSHIPANISLSNSASKPNGSLLGWSDFVGLAASVGCAIHCAALPFMFAVLPAWGFGWLAHESFHKWMFGFCFLVAIVAFVPGILRHHRMLPVAIGSLGLSLIGIGAFSAGACSCGSCSGCKVVPTNTPVIADSRLDLDDSFRKLSFSVSSSQPRLMLASKDSYQPDRVNLDRERVQQADDTDTSELWWERLAPWITPCGGLLLIVAHLLNHHYGNNTCRC